MTKNHNFKSDSIIWIDSPIIEGKPLYPVILDMADSAVSLNNSIISIAHSTIAPSYEELENFGLNRLNGPNWDDINDEESWEEHFRLWGLAKSIASMGKNYGIIFEHPEYYDPVSKKFVDLILEQSKITNFNVHFNTNSINNNINLFSTCDLNDMHYVVYDSNKINPYDKSSQIVALCPQGIEENILKTLAEKYDDTIFYKKTNPFNETTFFFPLDVREKILNKVSIKDRKKIYMDIANAWNPSGWGYIRRMGYITLCGDTKKMLQHHTEYLYGMETIGKEFLYCHYCGILNDRKGINYNEELNSLVSAARLAKKIRNGGGFDKSIEHYKQTISICKDPLYKAKLVYEIANSYAYRKDSFSLKMARKWYDLGFIIIRSITKEEDKISAEITLTNGLALVEYHSGNNLKALELENHAKTLSSLYPIIEHWAKPLLNTNLAKLLENRFNNIELAIEYLEENLDTDLTYVKGNSQLDIARFYFINRNFTKVVNILEDIFEHNHHFIINKEKEFYSRLIYIISLLISDSVDRAKLQIETLKFLCKILNNDRASNICNSIINCIMSSNTKTDL